MARYQNSTRWAKSINRAIARAGIRAGIVPPPRQLTEAELHRRRENGQSIAQERAAESIEAAAEKILAGWAARVWECEDERDEAIFEAIGAWEREDGFRLSDSETEYFRRLLCE